MSAAASILVAVFAAGPAPAGPQVIGRSSSLGAVDLEAVARGERIYVGRVFARDGPRGAPRFVYERRVLATETGATSVCITREGARVILVDVAEHGLDYQLRSFTEYQLQRDEVGRLELQGDSAEFTRARGSSGRIETRTETVNLPVLVAPTVYGFIVRSWSRLLGGEVVMFRYAVVSMLRTYGFELKRVTAPRGLVRIEMRASDLLVASVVAPSLITYTTDGTLVSYDGPTPMQSRGLFGWRDFEGHVEYSIEAQRFK